MRDVQISTEVFAHIWALRQPGEETEDAILRRVLPPISRSENENRHASSKNTGLPDQRHGVYFPEGFHVFRTYLGNDYNARITKGAWVLEGKSERYRSLNAVSRAIGAGTENAWINWYYRGPDGMRRLVSDLRNQLVPESNKKPNLQATPRDQGEKTTWRDDVVTALSSIGGKGRLREIYRAVERIRRTAGRSIPNNLQATVRQVLETHSSDSHNYKDGPDLFWMPEGKGVGIWARR